MARRVAFGAAATSFPAMWCGRLSGNARESPAHSRETLSFRSVEALRDTSAKALWVRAQSCGFRAGAVGGFGEEKSRSHLTSRDLGVQRRSRLLGVVGGRSAPRQDAAYHASPPRGMLLKNTPCLHPQTRISCVSHLKSIHDLIHFGQMQNHWTTIVQVTRLRVSVLEGSVYYTLV